MMFVCWMLGSVALAEDPPEGAESAEESAAEEATGPDRSAPPAVQDAEWMAYPEATEVAIRPGVDAWVVPVEGVRTVLVSVHIGRGAIELDGGWTPEVIAMDAHSALAIGDLDPGQLQAELARLDLSLWTSMDAHDSSFNMEVPRDELDRGLALLSDLIHRPVYPNSVVKNEQKDWVWYYENSMPRSLSSVARATLEHAWYDADHPYNSRPDLKGLSKVKGSGLVAAAERWRHAGPVRIAVVGDVTPEAMKAPLTALTEGLAAEGAWSEKAALEPVQQGSVTAVDMPGQTQAAVRLRLPAPSRWEADGVPFEAARWLYGGHFLSRLNANLREERGFTYGSRASYSRGDNEGYFTVSVDVKVENVAETVQQIRVELDRLIADGVTEDELAMLKRAKIASWNVTRQTASDAWSLYSPAVADGRPIAEYAAENARLSDLKVGDLQEAAERHLGADRPHTWVLVGDRKVLEGQLKEAGLEAQWLDPETAALGRF